jgi:indolepyruvate ferredoxin oxidoreductase alpha subunit
MSVTEKLTLSSDAPGQSLFMLGNEAIARGAMEAGVQVYAAYPGTPSSEISETLINLAKEAGYYAEWSVNEQVAFEVAFGASMCGVRAMTSMKNVGLNVAHEPLMSAGYQGAIGPFVVVVADDPGQWSSQNEQDNRYIGEQAYLPILEPSSPQEAKDMVVEAFRLSEEFSHVFMVRTVTRVSHARSDIKLGPIEKNKKPGNFQPDERVICMPSHMKKNRILMLERMAKIKKAVENLPYNRTITAKNPRLGIIASGISYAYAMEAVKWMGLQKTVSILKIGTPYPLPEEMVKAFLKSVPEVLILEELEPFVENHVRAIAQKAGIGVPIQGKGLIPIRLELSTRIAVEAIGKLLGVKTPVDFTATDKRLAAVNPILPQRPPTLCAGCPHRASFHAINVAVRKVKKDLGQRVLTGDIGCYSLGIFPPLNSYDTAICMGGGFGIANGVSVAHPGPVVGHLGDSTFFHSGIPPMINAVFNKTKVTLVILDNSATSMTGFQPNPGSPGHNEPGIKPEDIARACGVKFVEVVNCFDLEQTVDIIEKAIRFEGPAVVVSRGLCCILAQRDRKQKGEKAVPYVIDMVTCTDCKLCVNYLGCPALIIEKGKAVIDVTQCDGCGLCAQVCPTKSIIPVGGK